MAWKWAKTFGRWTLLYSDSVTPIGFPTRTAQGSCVLGNTPLSDISGNSSYPITWQILPDFKIVCASDGVNGQKRFHFYFNNVDSYYTDWFIDTTTRQFIGFVYDDNARKACCVMGRRYNSQGNYIYWVQYNSGSEAFFSQLYPYVKRAMDIIVPTWSSVPYLNCMQGRYHFTTLTTAGLDDGNGHQVSPNDVTYEMITIGQLFDGMVEDIQYNCFQVAEGHSFNVIKNSTNWVVGIKKDGNVMWGTTIPRTHDNDSSIGFMIDEEHHWGKFFFLTKAGQQGAETYFIFPDPLDGESDFNASVAAIYDFLMAGINNPGPEEIEPDGEGDLKLRRDTPVTGSRKPALSALDTGFVTLYNIGNLSLQALAHYMWTRDFIDWLVKLYNDPKDVVVGLLIMPIAPDVGSDSRVNAGNVFTDVIASPLSDQYKEYTFGTLTLDKQFFDFADYTPYTKVGISIPFCGYHDINVSDVMGNTLTLKYVFDFLTGACVAEIDVTNEDGTYPRYFFAGNAGMHIPISSGDYSNIYTSFIKAGAAVGTALATYATGGAGAGAIMALNNGMDVSGENQQEFEDSNIAGAIGFGSAAVGKVMSATPNIQYSSGGGGVNGYLSHRGAFLTIETPIRKKDAAQDSFLGRASLICVDRLDDCDGYTKCLKAHLDSINCYGEERSMIEHWLTSGVRISHNGTATPSYSPSSAGMIGVYVMRLTSDKDVIGKTWTNQTLIEGKLLYEQNVMHPKITFEGDYTSYSYAYIPLFERFYYIVSSTIERNTKTTLELSVDVLQSHKTGILNSPAMLDRQETKASKMLDDPMYWAQQNTRVITQPFMSGGSEAKFTDAMESYILIMAGPGGFLPPEPEESEEE